MKVALSYVDEEQAHLNLDTELDHWNFDRVVKESYVEWNRELGKIKVEGGTEQERVKFYTDLWHVLLGRHTYSDVNGKYTDNTGDKPLVCQVPLENGVLARTVYNSDGLWGSEFNLNILWSIAYPKVMSDFVSTLVGYYPTGGLIARGPSGGNYTYVMVDDQAIPLIAAAYNKGIRDFDAALEGSINYRYMFDPQAGWMRPRMKDGSWLKDFAPVGEGGNMPGFVESNIAIFTYYVPQNMPDLIYLIGGKDSFVNKLNRQFELATPTNITSCCEPSLSPTIFMPVTGNFLMSRHPCGNG